jgi:hypothetical protein
VGRGFDPDSPVTDELHDRALDLVRDESHNLSSSVDPKMGGGYMADAGLFIGWGEVVRGREVAAAELFRETLGYYASLQEQGVIESFEPVFLEPHGGDLAGFILIRGDAEKLAELRVSEEFTQLSIRVGLIVNNLGVVGADLGERLERQVEYYTEQIAAYA